jgi:hypothetical protein
MTQTPVPRDPGGTATCPGMPPEPGGEQPGVNAIGGCNATGPDSVPQDGSIAPVPSSSSPDVTRIDPLVTAPPTQLTPIRGTSLAPLPAAPWHDAEDPSVPTGPSTAPARSGPTG